MKIAYQNITAFKSIATVKVTDNAMTDRTNKSIMKHDILQINEVPRNEWGEGLNYKKNLFVIRIEGATFCRQITSVNGNTITCHAPQKGFKDFTLSLDTDVKALYQVERVIDRRIRL